MNDSFRNRAAIDKAVEMSSKQNAAGEAQVASEVKLRSSVTLGLWVGVLLLVCGWGLYTISQTVDPLVAQAKCASSAATQAGESTQSLGSAIPQLHDSIDEISRKYSQRVQRGAARGGFDTQNSKTITDVTDGSQSIANSVVQFVSAASVFTHIKHNEVLSPSRATSEHIAQLTVLANRVSPGAGNYLANNDDTYSGQQTRSKPMGPM